MAAIETSADPEEQRAALRLWVARAKVGGAVIGFAVATLVARRAGLDWVDAGLRGLLAAALFALVGWLCALLVINALMRTVVIHRRDEERRQVEELKALREQEAAAREAARQGEVMEP